MQSGTEAVPRGFGGEMGHRAGHNGVSEAGVRNGFPAVSSLPLWLCICPSLAGQCQAN